MRWPLLIRLLSRFSPKLLARMAALTCVGGAIFCALIALWVTTTLPVIRQQTVELPLRGGVLKGTLWLPEALPQPPVTATHQQRETVPGMVLLHGMASSRRTLEHLGKVLAYGGYAAFVPDLRGYGESPSLTRHSLTAQDYTEDAQAALQFLRSHPEVSAQQVGILGHSLGAAAVAELPALASDLRIALSFRPAPAVSQALSESVVGESTATPLRLWTGLYDPLHPPFLYDHLDFISPCAGHSLAPEDVCVQMHLLRSLKAHWSVPAGDTLRRAQLYFWALRGLGLCVLLGLMVFPFATGGYPLLLPYLLACLPFMLGGYFRIFDGPYSASAVGLITAAYALRQWPWDRLFRPLMVLLLAFAAHLSASGLRGLLTVLLGDVSSSMTAWLYFPVFVVQSVGFVPLWFHDKLLELLFVQQYARLEPGLFFFVFWGAEVILPGVWARLLTRGLLRVGASQKKQPGVSPEQRRQRMHQGLIAGSVLGAMLLAVLYWRYQQGYLYIKMLQNLGELVGSVLVPDLLVFWLYYRICKEKCPRDDSNIRPTV